MKMYGVFLKTDKYLKLFFYEILYISFICFIFAGKQKSSDGECKKVVQKPKRYKF